ncbi:MAG: hypothetical protein ACRDVL_09090 [Acidimicrobiia bacterium]
METIVFALASATHGGLFGDDYRHTEASTAEGVIAVVLLAGLAVSLVRPSLSRRAGLWAQGFALLGTLVGLFTIIIGVGPRTVPDVVFHSGLIVLLVWGLVTVARTGGDEPGQT